MVQATITPEWARICPWGAGWESFGEDRQFLLEPCQAPVRVVVAPDKFAGTLSAGEAAEAMRLGWLDRRPADQVRCLPMSDGGPGFCEVLAASLPGARRRPVPTSDPLGRPVTADLLVDEGGGERVSYVESALAVGLHLLVAAERDPERTSSAGLAALLSEAARNGATRIVVGLGGSATNDGGAGLLSALAAADHAHPGLIDAIRATDLVIATDVDNPLLGPNGATAVFGPQKGASREAVMRLEGRMQAWVRRQGGWADVVDLPGAGAAGGLGAALFWLGGHRVAGARVVADAVGLQQAVGEADLVVTGEGTYDATSLRGKVTAEVARAAQEAALPCLVIAGQLAVGEREAAAHGIDGSVATAELAGSVGAAMQAPAQWVRAAAARLASAWGT